MTDANPARASVASMSSASTRAQGNHGPCCTPARACRSTRTVAATDPAPGGATSTSTTPHRWSSSRTRASSAFGLPPMPMLPSRSTTERHRPSPGSGSNTDRVSTAAPRRTVSSRADGAVSIPSAGRPCAAAAATIRPGPQPTSSSGAGSSSISERSTSSASARHAPTCNGVTDPSVDRRSGPGLGRAAITRMSER